MSAVATHRAPAIAAPKAESVNTSRLALVTLDADRFRRLLIVADRLDRRAERATQQAEDDRQQAGHRAKRAPIGERSPAVVCVGVKLDQGGAGFAAHERVEVDKQMGQFRHHPHADGELAALKPKHQE